jgi:cobalt-zinc-cadmium efflux system membrane fusion protein
MRASLAIILTFIGLVCAGPDALAHEGHDHGNETPPLSASLPRGSAASTDFELVAVLRNGELTVYLDHFATNEPVAGASIEVETPEGPVTAEARDDGTYRSPAPWAKVAGRYDLIFTVAAGEKADVLPLSINVPEKSGQGVAGQGWSVWSRFGVGPLLLAGLAIVVGATLYRRRFVPKAAIALLAVVLSIASDQVRSNGGHDHSESQSTAPASRDIPQRLADGSVFVPKATQRLLAVRTALTTTGTHFKAVELPGRIISDPNASGYVQSALAGRLSPPPKGFPVLGTRVEKGEVLAYVTPPIQAIDISDMRQKEGELLQQISIVERRVARAEQLIKTDAISRTQLDDARLELKGLLERRSSLEQSRREPEALIAPVPGVIAAANTIAGQLAQPNSVIFEIVDNSRLWVEALSFEPVTPAGASSARGSNGRSVKLSYRGAGLAGRNQAIPIHFAIEDTTEGLWAGQFVTVYSNASEKHEGIALPRSAVVRASNGQHIVYDHTRAEVFEPREVRVAPLDGARVLVLAGLSEGQRIVTQGAELLDQVR